MATKSLAPMELNRLPFTSLYTPMTVQRVAPRSIDCPTGGVSLNSFTASSEVIRQTCAPEVTSSSVSARPSRSVRLTWDFGLADATKVVVDLPFQRSL